MIVALVLSALIWAEPASLTIGSVEIVAEGFKFTEGPLWLPEGRLIFSDIPANMIYAVEKGEEGLQQSVYRQPSGESNGLALDAKGRLIACEHGNRRVTMTEPDGIVKVLAETFEGKKLNSPNDVAVRADGTVFFTDPPYGLNEREAELDFSGVFAIRPDGTVKLLAKDFERPNGLAFSPDQRTLYVADTTKGHVRAFDVAEDGTLSNGGIFCELPGPDGMKVDVAGRLWCTARDGVRVMDAKGKLIQTIAFPQVPANCAFGDVDLKTLYVTARTAVYKIRCMEAGAAGFGRSK